MQYCIAKIYSSVPVGMRLYGAPNQYGLVRSNGECCKQEGNVAQWDKINWTKTVHCTQTKISTVYENCCEQITSE